MPVGVFSLIFKRRHLAGSAIGGIRETQEMLDFCAEHGIAADVEMIPIQKINEAYDAAAQGRREVPLRDRHGVVEVTGGRPRPSSSGLARRTVTTS